MSHLLGLYTSMRSTVKGGLHLLLLLSNGEGIACCFMHKLRSGVTTMKFLGCVVIIYLVDFSA
uniref:Uncharacterized protein n=1 Tax=Rhizophora mucronata TaxID=61149 RepID=A0A2P2Q9L3_RHIMU